MQWAALRVPHHLAKSEPVGFSLILFGSLLTHGHHSLGRRRDHCCLVAIGKRGDRPKDGQAESAGKSDMMDATTPVLAGSWTQDDLALRMRVRRRIFRLQIRKSYPKWGMILRQFGWSAVCMNSKYLKMPSPS